jgi:hypothetical protein
MTDNRVRKTFKSVNSKHIVNDINLFVEEALREFGIQWDSEAQRTSFVEILEDFLYDTAEQEGKIVAFKVMCDRRNNKASDNERGIYQLDIHFNQKNCLNTTQLIYTIDTNVKVDDDFGIDYVI